MRLRLALVLGVCRDRIRKGCGFYRFPCGANVLSEFTGDIATSPIIKIWTALAPVTVAALVVFLAAIADRAIPATGLPGKSALVIVKPAGVVPSREAHSYAVECTATFVAGAAPTIAASPTAATVREAEATLAAAVAAVAVRATAAAEALAPFSLPPSTALGIGFVNIQPHSGERATEQNSQGATPGYSLAQPVNLHRQPIEPLTIHCTRLLRLRLAAVALHSRCSLSAPLDKRRAAGSDIINNACKK